jgi:hypothetical protein
MSAERLSPSQLKQHFVAERRRLRDEFIQDESWMLNEVRADGTPIKVIPLRSHHYTNTSDFLRRVSSEQLSKLEVIRKIWNWEKKLLINSSQGSSTCREDYLGKIVGELGEVSLNEYSETERAVLGLENFELRQRKSLYLQTSFGKDSRIYEILQNAGDYLDHYFRVGPFEDYVCQTAQQLEGGYHCPALILRRDEINIIEGLDVYVASLLLHRYLKVHPNVEGREFLRRTLFNTEAEFISNATAEYLLEQAGGEEYHSMFHCGWKKLHPTFVVGTDREIELSGKFLRAFIQGDQDYRPIQECVVKIKKNDMVGRPYSLLKPGTVVEVPYMDIRTDIFNELIFSDEE